MINQTFKFSVVYLLFLGSSAILTFFVPNYGYPIFRKILLIAANIFYPLF